MGYRVQKAIPFLMLLAVLCALAGCQGLQQHNVYGVVPATVPPIAPPGAYLYHVFMLSAQEGWATGATFSSTGSPQKAMLVHYTGGSWQEIPVSTPMFGLFFTSPTNGWAVGLHGAIMHYDGTSWTSVTSPTTYVLRDVVLSSANDGWAVGDHTILHYNGQTWTDQFIGATLMALALVSADEGWAIGESGEIWHLSGGQWNRAQTPTSNDLNGIFMLSASEGWAVGANGAVLHYSGGAWSFAQSPNSTEWYSVSFTSPTDGWASGEDGTVMHYHGGQWTINSKDTIKGYDLSSIAMVSADEGWAVGQKNIIRHYQQGTWSTFAILP
jgi:photosystem II stability/assembly factor-like uncharacterized protein